MTEITKSVRKVVFNIYHYNNYWASMKSCLASY